MTYTQINYMYIQKESVRCILIKIKGFSNVKGFHNEHGYISYFKFIFCFYKFNKVGHIQSFPTIWFNICFFLIHGTTDVQLKNEIHLPNNLNRFYMYVWVITCIQRAKSTYCISRI